MLWFCQALVAVVTILDAVSNGTLPGVQVEGIEVRLSNRRLLVNEAGQRFLLECRCGAVI